MTTTLKLVLAVTVGATALLAAPEPSDAQQYRKRGARVYVAPRVYSAPPRHTYVRRVAPVVVVGAPVAYYYGTRYYYGGGLTCGQLEARCDAGYEWACRRLDVDPGC